MNKNKFKKSKSFAENWICPESIGLGIAIVGMAFMIGLVSVNRISSAKKMDEDKKLNDPRLNKAIENVNHARKKGYDCGDAVNEYLQIRKQVLQEHNQNNR